MFHFQKLPGCHQEKERGIFLVYATETVGGGALNGRAYVGGVIARACAAMPMYEVLDKIVALFFSVPLVITPEKH